VALAQSRAKRRTATAAAAAAADAATAATTTATQGAGTAARKPPRSKALKRKGDTAENKHQTKINGELLVYTYPGLRPFFEFFEQVLKADDYGDFLLHLAYRLLGGCRERMPSGFPEIVRLPLDRAALDKRGHDDDGGSDNNGDDENSSSSGSDSDSETRAPLDSD
jgi:hypothetical protein